MTNPSSDKVILRWRKKPVVIEAWKVPRSEERLSGVPPMWLLKATIDGVITFVPEELHAMIETKEGRMRADPGDWIIRGVKGELYPCKPDIFEATYEPA